MEIYDWMIWYQHRWGAPPSVREIANHFQMSSTNGVNDHLKLMQKKGMVIHRPKVARGWVARPDYREQYNALYR